MTHVTSHIFTIAYDHNVVESLSEDDHERKRVYYNVCAQKFEVKNVIGMTYVYEFWRTT